MDKRSPLTLAQQVAAAQDWWRDAGVDSAFADAPRNWLEQPLQDALPVEAQPVHEKPPRPAIPPLGGDPGRWPQTLAEFSAWWLSGNGPETGGTAPRVPPRGATEAQLMVLVAMPEVGDSERLLSGPHGELIGNMLRAMGIADDAAYLASALPRHAGHPDWQHLASCDLGKIVSHHVQLVNPKRLLMLGRAMLPLFGHDPAQAGANPREFALQGCGVPALVSFGPETLLQRAQFRAGLWRGWLNWTGGDQ